MKHALSIIISALLVMLFSTGCTSVSKEITQPTGSSPQTTATAETWVSIISFSDDISHAIAQIEAVGAKSVNYTVDNSISVDIKDPNTIAAIVDAIKAVEVGNTTDMRKTDSGRRIIFYLEDGTETLIAFSSDEYIEVGKDAYQIRNFGALKSIERDLY